MLRPLAQTGHDPVSSMGDDASIAPLAGRARPFSTYLRQRFAQVTNPAIDHLRERLVMSVATLLGPRVDVLGDDGPPPRLTVLPGFLLYPSGLESLSPLRLDATFSGEEGLGRALDRIVVLAESAVTAGAELLCLSDRDAGGERAPVPAILALSAVHTRLVEAGLRTRCSLLVESDEPRDTHTIACLLGYGADAICPRLALETVAQLAANDRDRRRPPDARRGAAPPLRGVRGGRPEGHVQDGHRRRRELPRRTAVRCGRARSHALPRVPGRHTVRTRRRTPRPLRARGARAPRDVSRGEAAAREPRLLQVPQGRRAARDRPRRRGRAAGGGRGCARAAGSDARRPLRPVRPLRRARERPRPARAARPARARPSRPADPAGRGRAGLRDRASLLERSDVARRALRRGARDRRDRAQPPRRARELGRGRREPRSGTATSATRRSSRSRRAGSA